MSASEINSKRKNFFLKRKYLSGAGAENLRFLQSGHGGGRGQHYTPIFVITFLWTLASYSILVIGYCPTFKYSLYYVIISTWPNKNYQSKQKQQKQGAI